MARPLLLCLLLGAGAVLACHRAPVALPPSPGNGVLDTPIEPPAHAPGTATPGAPTGVGLLDPSRRDSARTAEQRAAQLQRLQDGTSWRPIDTWHDTTRLGTPWQEIRRGLAPGQPLRVSVALWPVPARVVHVSDTNIVVLAEPLPHGRLSRRELRCAEATGIVLQIELRPETATWTQIRTEVRGAAGCDASAEFGQRLHAIPLHFMSSVHEAALRASQGLGLPQ